MFLVSLPSLVIISLCVMARCYLPALFTELQTLQLIRRSVIFSNCNCILIVNVCSVLRYNDAFRNTVTNNNNYSFSLEHVSQPCMVESDKVEYNT